MSWFPGFNWFFRFPGVRNRQKLKCIFTDADPALYRGYLCNVLAIPPTSSDVVDLTGYIGWGTFIASGGYGQVFQGKWKDIGGVALANSDVLPSVAVKVVSVPPLRDEREKGKRLKVSIGMIHK